MAPPLVQPFQPEEVEPEEYNPDDNEVRRPPPAPFPPSHHQNPSHPRCTCVRDLPCCMAAQDMSALVVTCLGFSLWIQGMID